MTARLVEKYGADFSAGADVDRPGEIAILSSMAVYGWWPHYGQPTPAPLPASFDDGPARVVNYYFGPSSGGSRLYYRGVAWLFDTLRIDDVVTQMYVMRLVAAFAALVTLLAAWFATRRWLDERAAMVITASLALHPQFIIVSTTASPDAVVALAATLCWWSVVSMLSALRQADCSRPIHDVRLFGALAAMWCFASMAFLVRRMGAPTLVLAAGMTLGLLLRLVWGNLSVHRRLSRAALAMIVVLLVGSASWWFAPTDAAMAGQWSQLDIVQAARSTLQNAGDLPTFVRSMFESFWLTAGWLRYRAPSTWYALALAITLGGVIGLALRRYPTAMRGTAVAAVAFALLQIGSVVAFYFGILGIGPQGRYLFPAIAVILSLLWLGWRAWFPAQRQALAAVSLISLMAALNLGAWTLVVLPAYLGDVSTLSAGR